MNSTETNTKSRKTWLALAKPPLLFGLAEITQKEHVIEVIYHNTPFGYHFTVHDANERYPHGVVQIRLNPQKGEVKSCPSGERISDERGMVHSWEIPPFREIDGVISIYNRGAPIPLALTMIPTTAQLFEQPKKLGVRDIRGSNLVVASASSNAIGWDILLLGPFAFEAFQNWVRNIAEMARRLHNLAAIGSIHVFTEFVPWLAILMFEGATNDDTTG